MKCSAYSFLLSIVCVFFSDATFAVEEFTYSYSQEIATDTLHYTKGFRFSINKSSEGSYHITYIPRYHFRGLNVKTHILPEEEKLSGVVSSATGSIFMKSIETLNLTSLRTGKQLILSKEEVTIEDSIIIDGQTISGNARKKLHDLIFKFWDKAKAELSIKAPMLEIEGGLVTPIDTTLEELQNNPDQYHGKRIRVSGYHHRQFEYSIFTADVDNVFVSYSQARRNIWFSTKSSFATEDEAPLPNNTYLLVEGTFLKGLREYGKHRLGRGHFGVFPGEILLITRSTVLN